MPVLMITDLAPHVDNDFRDRKNRDVIADRGARSDSRADARRAR